MKSWWKDNWDKVVTAVVSIILAGVIGFFSAILTVKEEIKSLTSDVAVLNEKSKNFEKAISDKTNNERTIIELNRRVNSLEHRNKLEEIRLSILQTLAKKFSLEMRKELEELIQASDRNKNE